MELIQSRLPGPFEEGETSHQQFQQGRDMSAYDFDSTVRPPTVVYDYPSRLGDISKHPELPLGGVEQISAFPGNGRVTP